MEIVEILKGSVIEGNIVKLPNYKLDRTDYLDVKNALELIGGKWKGGKTQGFVFNEDPTDYIEKLRQGEQINIKKEYQFFATPPTLADYLVQLAEIEHGHALLEPSAGQGAIVEAIHRVQPDTVVDCYELMDLNRTFLEKQPNTNILGNDFLTEKNDNLYDRIIANPPFSKNQDLDHVHEMWNRLEDNGRLVSIMSNHWRISSNKKEKAFQNFIDEVHAEVIDIEQGVFKESGTNISACIVVIDKQHSDNLKNILNAIGNFEKGEKEKKKSKKHNPVVSPSEESKAKQQLQKMFESFMYRHGASEVFGDFLDYCLLAMKWWEQDRNFSYWEKKYKDLYPKLPEMLNLLGIISDDCGEGCHDALGDLFMELVSHGHNGQYFTPDNVCIMMAQMLNVKPEDEQNVLDPACGSGRMLLSGARINRKARLFGCDIDIICCKMAVINLLINTLEGEIAWMDSLAMDYHKSWYCSHRNFMGVEMPVYWVIEDKEQSPLWQMHINTFEHNKAQREAAKQAEETKQPVQEETIPTVEATPQARLRKKNKDVSQLTLNFFDE